MNFSEETQFLIALSQKAGDMARTAFNPAGCEYDIKDDQSPVTVTDIAINQMVIDEVKERYPEWGVLGEELQYNTDAETLLVVDPIDGTKAFMWGSATFGFMAALVKEGISYSGIMYNPLIERTLVSQKGGGSWLLENQERLEVSSATSIKGERIYLHTGSMDAIPLLRAAGGNIAANHSVAEAATMIAKGSWVGCIMYLNTPHDIAAPKVIVEEAGGKVTDLDGNEQRYDQPINGAVISNGHVHDELVTMYRESHT